MPSSLPQQPERHPASSSSGPPPCWSLFRGTETCAACEWRVSCERRTDAYKARLTVADAVAALPPADPGALPATLVDLLDLVDERWSAVAPGRRRPLTEHKPDTWRRALQAILDTCDHEGWDSRLYIQAQVDSLFKFLASQGHAPNAGHFVGQGANIRFMKWCNERRRGRGDERSAIIDDRVATARRNLAACCERATRYMVGGTMAEAIAHAQEVFPGVDIAAQPPDYHLRSLEAGLASVDPALPSRVLLAADGTWTWSSARAAAWLFMQPLSDDGEAPDEDLGWLGDLV